MRRRVRPKHLVWAAAALAAYVAFIANGSYFVDRYIRPFEFGEPEMVEVFESFNRHVGWKFAQGDARYLLTLTLEREQGADVTRASLSRPLMSLARACGSRTFRQSAAACLDTTSLTVVGQGSLVRFEGTNKEVVRKWTDARGSLVAYGRELGEVQYRQKVADAYMVLRSEDARAFQLLALYIGESDRPLLTYDRRH